MTGKYLFIAETPNQLINAAALASSANDVSCEICCMGGIRHLIPRIEESGLFSKVFTADVRNDTGSARSKLLRKVLQLRNTLSFGKIRKFEFVKNAREYRMVFLSGENFRIFEVFYLMRKRNPELRLSVYEEGLCEYLEFGTRELNEKARLSRRVFGSYFKEDCSFVYVYAPQLVKNVWDSIEVKEIPKEAFTADFLDKLSQIFEYSGPVMEDGRKKIVFLDSAFVSGSRREKQQEEIVRVTKDLCCGKEMVIKLHPRSEEEKFGPDLSYLRSRVPMELIAFREDLEKVLFITIGSSAAMNLFVECDSMTEVIILDDMMDGNCGELFKKAASAKKRGRMEIPQNMEEYRHLLKEFLNEGSD